MSGLREIAPGDWDAVLERLDCADSYLRHDYVRSACLLDEGEPVLLHLAGDGGEVVFACIARPVPGLELRDLTTPYGYGGPVAVGPDPPTTRFYELYDRWCAAQGLVSTFVRFHPLFANQRHAGPGIVTERAGLTVGWRLHEGDLFAPMHRSHRNKCRKAQRAGVEVEVTEAPTDLSAFVRLYGDTMRRQQASAFYFFPGRYWDFLAGPLSGGLVLFDALLDGEVVASALCLAARPWLHYHLSATLDAARELGASNLLLYEAAEWARRRGFTVFHLGGGLGGREDSLFSFKRCFSPDDVLEFWVGKAVHDTGAYLALSGHDALGFEGFFPAYRVPGALSQTAGTPERR